MKISATVEAGDVKVGFLREKTFIIVRFRCVLSTSGCATYCRSNSMTRSSADWYWGRWNLERGRDTLLLFRVHLLMKTILWTPTQTLNFSIVGGLLTTARMGTPDCVYSSISSIDTSTDQKEQELATAMSLKAAGRRQWLFKGHWWGPVMTTGQAANMRPRGAKLRHGPLIWLPGSGFLVVFLNLSNWLVTSIELVDVLHHVFPCAAQR